MYLILILNIDGTVFILKALNFAYTYHMMSIDFYDSYFRFLRA